VAAAVAAAVVVHALTLLDLLEVVVVVEAMTTQAILVDQAHKVVTVVQDVVNLV
jgi:hypothetical protein